MLSPCLAIGTNRTSTQDAVDLMPTEMAPGAQNIRAIEVQTGCQRLSWIHLRPQIRTQAFETLTMRLDGFEL